MSEVVETFRSWSSPDGPGREPLTCAFVMPHYDEGPTERGPMLLKEAVRGVLEQTQTEWQLVIVDDASPSENARNALRELKGLDPRVVIIEEPERRGPGHCRNVGIAYAHRKNLPIVVFNDADDVSHAERVEVVSGLFASDPTISVVYSHFRPVDDSGATLHRSSATPSIIEILDALDGGPPEGDDVWIDIATRTGYVNLTSATAVRTRLAYAFPFPEEYVSEDLHTWLRYSAAGGRFRYTDAVPSDYRLRLGGAGSASRDRVGGATAFYRLKLRNDLDGFVRAIELAISRGSFNPMDRRLAMSRFFNRIAISMAREGQATLARWATEQAGMNERLAHAAQVVPEISG